MRRGGWGGEKGSTARMDGYIDAETSEEERNCLAAGDAAASSYMAKRLTTLREPHLERRAERQREEGQRLSHIHLALRSVALGSCWKMKNYMALIRLHYRTSDYMHLTLVQKNKKMKEGEGNIHDLINYVIMWYLFWL